MTTIDELRTRKRLLLAQKREAAQAGDKWEAAFVNEELLSVNAQLRELVGKRRARRGRDTSQQWASDRRQFERWRDREGEEEAEQEWQAMREKAAASLEVLTPRQREILSLRAGGMRCEDIAEELGVDKSTVSRTLARAKANAAETVRKAKTGEKLLEDGGVDLNRGDALKAVVLSLTPKQLVYFYLYYSEGLTLREAGALTGTDHAAICRTVKRALLRLDRLFPGGAILDHPEAVDEAAYWAWTELSDRPELVPEPVRALVQQREAPKKPYKRDRKPAPEAKTTVRRSKKERPGKLLEALREKSGLFRWLERVFAALKMKLKGE